MYETVGNFGGAPGWTVIHQMPERKAIVLAKSNIKIAHKFSTGWWLGNFKAKVRNEEAYKVRYPVELGSTEGLVYSQKLLPSDYGCDKMWVALKRDQQSAAAQRRVQQQPSADQRAEGPAAPPPRPDPTADVPPLPAPASRLAAASSTALPRPPSNAHGAAAAAGLRHAAAAARSAQL